MKRIAIISLVLLILTGAAIAEANSSPLIANVAGRTTVSLNGVWRAITDPFDVGRSGRFYKNYKPKDKHELVEYDFDSSPTMIVPGDWNSQRDNLFFYEGTVWYKKSFNYSKRPHTRVFVYFGAVTSRATVHLNGIEVGKHEGGYTAFNFEITDKLRDGENFFVVEVNNQRRKEAVPPPSTDWWNYGGITRDVELVEVPEVFIKNYKVQLAKGSTSELEGWIQLSGAAQPQPVTVEIPELGFKKTVTANADGYAEFRQSAKLKLWTPEDPKLYNVVVSTPGDSISDEIGFRTIETRGSKILLNGKPYFLRGISTHEEAPYRGGRAFSADDDRTLLGWAKELGCNFIRLAHYPHNENMTRLADRVGLLVWSEIPVYWDTDWTNPATLANAREQLRDNIARDQNRASVIFWSVGNETPTDPDRTTFLTKMATDAHQLDPARLVTAALNRMQHSEPQTRTVADPLAQQLDVLGINEYLGWYEGSLADTEKVQWKTTYDKPIIVSEFGASAPYGNHGEADARWTEEFQASFYEHHIKMWSRVSEFAGLSPWVLMDFRSPRRLLPGVQDYRNRKGLVSDRGERKKAFYTLQQYYHQLSSEAEAQSGSASK
jgi:beta-glucuronidase